MSYYITTKSFKLDPRYIEPPPIKLGYGVDMNDPRCPTKSELPVFNPEERGAAGTKELKTWAPISKDDITDTFMIKEQSTVQEESNTLHQYFKASYGLASRASAPRPGGLTSTSWAWTRPRRPSMPGSTSRPRAPAIATFLWAVTRSGLTS